MLLSFFCGGKYNIYIKPKLFAFLLIFFIIAYMISELFTKIKRDIRFRTQLFLCASFTLNIVYSIFLFAVSYINSSRWFFVMSLYYGLLCSLRGFVFFRLCYGKSETSKIKTMFFCGLFLLFMNTVISALMFILIHGDKFVKHHEITVIAIAAYTFATLIIAIVGSIKRLRANHAVYFSAKCISLVSAGVSMVTLTDTMLATWGGNNELLRSIILPLLSGTVAVFIIACALFMMRKSVCDLRNLKNEKE